MIPQNRRKFLASLALVGATPLSFSDPLQKLLESILQGAIIRSAMAETPGGRKLDPCRNYVAFHLYGSPLRWVFDNPLRPSDKDGFIPSLGMVNKFKNPGRGSTEMIYGDTPVSGINMPHMWNYSVPSRNSEERPLSDLIQNMMIIRGIESAGPGHPMNSRKLANPSLTGTSFTALIAENSKTPIPAISLGRSPFNRAYRSKKGVNMVEIPPEHPNYAEHLLTGFIRGDEENFRNNPETQELVERAFDQLRSYAMTNNPGAETLYKDRERVEKLISRGLDGLIGVYSQLVQKYQGIVDRGLKNNPTPEICDQPIPGAEFPMSLPGDVSTLNAFAFHHHFGKVICDKDLRKAYRSAATLEIARQFALAEFALKEELSSSIALSPFKEQGDLFSGVFYSQMCKIEDIQKHYSQETNTTRFELSPKAKKFGKAVKMPYDSHFIGYGTNTYSCTLFYRAFAGCLLELIDQLKVTKKNNGSLFDETLLHVTTEFDRLPTQGGAEFDHNYSGQVTSLYSGIIKGPILIGNTYVGAEGDKYPGSTGMAAPVEGLDEKPVDMNHVSSTLSEIARVPSLVNRSPSLVKISGDRVRSQVEWGHNIPGRHPLSYG